jgi:hypothetical protein
MKWPGPLCSPLVIVIELRHSVKYPHYSLDRCMYSPVHININTCFLKYFLNQSSNFNAVTAISLQILLATRL